MPTILVRETYVNADSSAAFGETPWFEPYTNDRAKLFRDWQKEYGGCTGRMYVDIPNDDSNVVEAVPVGYVFRKRMRYEDARGEWSDRLGRRVYSERDYYTREVWVKIKFVADPGTDNDDIDGGK